MSSNTAALGPADSYLSRLLKNLPGMAYRFANDGQWTMEYVSEGAFELTGWRPDELVDNPDRTIFHLAHPDDIEAGYAVVEAALADRVSYQLSYRIRARDGQVKWVFEQGQGVFDREGRVEAVEGFISDITRQKEAELALKRSERRFRSIFENAIFGVFQSTPDGRFIILNPSAARILGYASPQEALEHINNIATDMYVDADQRERFLDAIRREGCVEEWMSRMRRRDGSTIWVKEKSRGVFGSDGELRYIEGTVRDVTDELAARTALQDSEVRASELRAQLADAQLRALRLQLKPHFLFNVLNTVSMMIRVGESDQAQQVVTMLGDLFRHVLELEGEQTVSLEQELRFCELYLRLQQFRFADRLEIRRDVDTAALPVHVPTMVLQPIAENAVTHGVAEMAGQCIIDIKAHRHGDSLRVEICNDSPGDGRDGAGYGIGLTNTRARLRDLYGEKAAFELVRSGGRASAVLTLPVAGSRK